MDRLQFSLDLRGRDHGFDNDWAVIRDELGDLLEPQESREADRDMLAIWVNFAYMDLSQALPEPFKQIHSHPHRRINLSGMTYVEAEARIWKAFEHSPHFRNSSSRWLSLVHVLNTQPLAKETPLVRIRNDIGMNNNKPSQGDLAQD